MSEFHRVLLGLHAQARRIDRDQALLGALGVGAFPYPHQLDSVHRMITGTACRWLLADEVGLGKTVQAIMTMRALAAQSPSPLRVALVVPDDLALQWEEELLCRGHVLALEHGDPPADNGNLDLRLVRQSLLAKDKKIVPENIDLLLVDEFPRLTVQVRHDLVTAARSISNVVLMTATPNLHLAATRRELLTILEPEAARVAQLMERDILEVLAERERSAEERYGAEFQDIGRRRAVEENFSLYRRIIRTQRRDYPEALPQRTYQPMRLSPTDGDVERGQTTREYISAARAANLDIRSDLLLQVAGRCRQSLRDRLSTLRRTTPNLQAAWLKIERCLRDEPGDTRLDALIDHVRGVHARSPNTRIVVVAEDNPTTDYLREALEKLAGVRVANKRRSTIPAEDLEVHVTLLKDALDDFISGEAKVLVAADIAREGHNLQFADEIIFFALPWSPPEIQQWIGRIDRLGTKVSASRRRIAVTPLVVAGSIESRILDVLEATNVFQRSEVFDDSEWVEISTAINEAAYGHSGASWGNATKLAKAIGATYDEWLRATRFPPSPRTTLAVEFEASLRLRSYTVPLNLAPRDAAPNWFHIREVAIDKLLRLAGEEHLDIRKGHYDEQVFSTMWYKKVPSAGALIFSELDPHSSWYRETYIARRAAIECPPTKYVVQRDGRKRRLHFFDHGNILHDSIIAKLEKDAPKAELSTEYVVDFPLGHPILRWKGRRLLLAVAELDLTSVLTFDADALLLPDDAKLSKPEQAVRANAIRRMLNEFQADRRWLCDLCPSELIFAAAVENGDDVIAVDAAAALLDPFLGNEVAQQHAKRQHSLPEARLLVWRNFMHAQLKKVAGERLQRAVHSAKRAAPARLSAAQAEAENYASAARAEIEAAARRDTTLEFNRAEERAAKLALDLAEAVWLHRSKFIGGASTRFLAGKVKKMTLLMVLPRPRASETD